MYEILVKMAEVPGATGTGEGKSFFVGKKQNSISDLLKSLPKVKQN